MRTCSRCKISKALSEFHAPPPSSVHYSRYCIQCSRKRSKEYNKTYVKKPAYNIWVNLRRRCYGNKKGYGDRGITFDPSWTEYDSFWEDMGSTYKPGLSIDRIDVNGNYSKENCRWATPLEQANNRRNTRMVYRNGVTKSLAEWCRDLGLNYNTTRSRLYFGFSPEQTLEISLERRKK